MVHLEVVVAEQTAQIVIHIWEDHENLVFNKGIFRMVVICWSGELHDRSESGLWMGRTSRYDHI